MKGAQPLKAYPVTATIPVGSLEKILVAIFSSVADVIDNKKITALITGTGINEPIHGEIKKEGDLFSVYGSLSVTRPGNHDLLVEISHQKSVVLEMNCKLTAGSFKERLAARMLEDFTGKEFDGQLYQYVIRLFDMGATNDHVAGELMKSKPARKKIISDLFVKYLHRGPNKKEWADLLEKLGGEDGIEGLKNFILSSKEYFKNAGRGTNEGLLAALTRDLTGSGEMFPANGRWLKALDSDEKVVSQIIAEIQQSLPAAFYTAAGYYKQYYHRPATGRELGEIVNNVRSHKTGTEHLGIDFNAPTYFEPPLVYQVPRNLIPDGKVPDYTFQFYINLEQAGALADGMDVRQVLLNSIKKVLADLGPKYDDQLSRDLHVKIIDLIPYSQVDSIPWNGQENGAVWFDGGKNDFSLKLLTELQIGTAYTFSLSAASIKKVMDIVWDRYPKRLNNSGKADPDGDIELRDYSVIMEKNTLSFRINATYHVPGGLNIGVSVTYTDVFSLDAGNLKVESSHKLEFDAGIDWLAAFSALVYMLTPLTFAESARQQLKLREPHLPDFSFGTVLKGFFPTTILVPGSKSKLVFLYNNADIVTPDRILLSGIDFPFTGRQPAAFISEDIDVYFPDYAKHYVVIAPPTPTLVKLKFTFVVMTWDLAGPLQFVWTTDGVLSNQVGNSVDVTWHFDPHKRSQRHLQVHVTDGDNLQADASTRINFLAKERKKPVPDSPPPNRIPFRETE